MPAVSKVIECLSVREPLDYLRHQGRVGVKSARSFSNVSSPPLENACLTSITCDSGWKCERGYRIPGENCVAVEIPKNAHLNFSGNGWECNKPHRRAIVCVNKATEMTQEDQQNMDAHGITEESKTVYHYKGFKYDRLNDSVRYARVDADRLTDHK